MLFNPNAERFTFNQLRNMVIRARTDLKERLATCLQEKGFAEEIYLKCQKTESDQRAFDEERKLWDERIERIDQTAYRHIAHDLLLKEQLYGFGTPLPVTPQSAIEVIPPNYWLFLELNPDKSEAHGHGLHYVGVFFQQVQDVPKATVALVKERQSNAAIAMPDNSPPAQASEVACYTSPFVQLQIDALKHFDIDPDNPPLKKTVASWLQKEADARGIELSGRMLESLATSIRPLEAQKGGNKKQPEPA